MKNILNYTLEELENILQTEFNAKSFVAKQIWNWIYSRGVKDFDSMSNISKKLKEDLMLNKFLQTSTFKIGMKVRFKLV